MMLCLSRFVASVKPDEAPAWPIGVTSTMHNKVNTAPPMKPDLSCAAHSIQRGKYQRGQLTTKLNSVLPCEKS